MSFSRVRTFYFALVFISLAACGRVGEVSSSRVLHTWGDVVRGQAPMGGFECPADVTGLALRLKKLVEKLGRSNAETFKNELDISSFCFVVDENDATVSASSSPNTKRVVFSPKLIGIAKSEAQLAAVVAHELAHISLQHAGAGELSPRVLKTDAGGAMNFQLQLLQEDVKRLAESGAPASEIFAVNDRYGKILSKLNLLTDDVYGEQNAHFNWLEQEADEVGAEFYVRAGFDISDFAAMIWSSHMLSSEQILECKSLIQSAVDGSDVRPSRGMASHPTPCWRGFHLLVDEYGPHGAHFSSP
jgi:hypothetical protein